ncbi:MAG: SRPBCC domain-containing protein [Bacilli bacterium]
MVVVTLWHYGNILLKRVGLFLQKACRKLKKPTLIKVEATIDLPLETVWIRWTTPKHIIHWNFATSDWQCPRAKNDLKKGGQFVYRMEAKDGSTGFDFSGKYLSVKTNQQIEAFLDDGRALTISFQNLGNKPK